MISDERFRAKLAHRGRGLAELDRRVGGIVADIEARLALRPRVRVLELGCGWGTALLELGERYGERVDLHGLNRRPGDGDESILRRNALDRGLGRAAAALPTLAYADAAQGLPYADSTFDLVYSQVAWPYFGNKIGVLREVMRVLRDDGVARIDAHERYPRLPAEYARLVEIWEDGRLVPFRDYVRRYAGDRGDAAGERADGPPQREFVRFGKRAGFGEDLRQVLEVDTATLHPAWDGVKCVYTRVPPPDAGGPAPAALSAGHTGTG